MFFSPSPSNAVVWASTSRALCALAFLSPRLVLVYAALPAPRLFIAVLPGSPPPPSSPPPPPTQPPHTPNQHSKPREKHLEGGRRREEIKTEEGRQTAQKGGGMKDKDSGDGRRMTGGIRGNGGKQTNAGRKEKFSEGREREDRRAFGRRRESIWRKDERQTTREEGNRQTQR